MIGTRSHAIDFETTDTSQFHKVFYCLYRKMGISDEINTYVCFKEVRRMSLHWPVVAGCHRTVWSLANTTQSTSVQGV